MLPRSRPASLALCSLLALFAPNAHAQGVRILEAPGLGLLPDLQSAVDAAADGDTLIVASGVYGPFIVDNRSLWIVALEPGSVSINGTIHVRNTTPKDEVVMIGIEAQGLGVNVVSDPGLTLTDNKGHLRFQQCSFRGGKGTMFDITLGGFEPVRGAGGTGVSAFDNKRVSFVDCVLEGGVGGGKADVHIFDEGGPGGHGMDAELSTVVLYDSAVTGGVGGVGGSLGGLGGSGYTELDFGVVVVNCNLSGGDGGYAWDVLPLSGGSGGDALFVDANAQAQLVDNSLLRGNPGGACCGGASGSFGKLKNGAGVIVNHPVAARTFKAAHIASDGRKWTVKAGVEPGDVAFFFGGRRSSFKVASPAQGVFLTPLPTTPISFPGALFGQPAGAPQVSPVLGNLAGTDQLTMFWQGAVREGGQLLPCSPAHVVVFNRAGLPDCDADGVNDYLAIHEDLVPDCNNNLRPDACDIALGTSLDANANGIPDECESPEGSGRE